MIVGSDSCAWYFRLENEGQMAVATRNANVANVHESVGLAGWPRFWSSRADAHNSSKCCAAPVDVLRGLPSSGERLERRSAQVCTPLSELLAVGAINPRRHGMPVDAQARASPL